MTIYGKARRVNLTNLPTRLLVAAMITLACFIAAYVALVVDGHAAEAGTLIGIGVPIVLALLGIGHLSAVAQDTNQKVEHLLNGGTTEQLRGVIRDELVAKPMIPTADDAHPAPPGTAVTFDLRQPEAPQSPVRRSDL